MAVRNAPHAYPARVMAARCARDATPRTAPMARRRDGDIAPYRHYARALRTAHYAGVGRTAHYAGAHAVRGRGGVTLQAAYATI